VQGIPSEIAHPRPESDFPRSSSGLKPPPKRPNTTSMSTPSTHTLGRPRTCPLATSSIAGGCTFVLSKPGRARDQAAGGFSNTSGPAARMDANARGVHVSQGKHTRATPRARSHMQPMHAPTAA
jgi:hypothetical protein